MAWLRKVLTACWPFLIAPRSFGSDLRNCVGERPTIRLNARLKSSHEGGFGESLPSQIRGLLSARNAQMPEKHTAVFCNFMLREVKRAAFRQC